ncbi:MAG: Ig-like domain-containing protein, partial [Sphingomonadaceae bacterium]
MEFDRISGRGLDQQASADAVETSATQAATSQELKALAALQQAAGNVGAIRVVPGPDGVVTLPEGVSLDQIRVSGRDLIVQLPDGSQMVIVDGAVFVPQIVLGGVEIPPLNLAALLIGNEPQPAAGPPRSSGGNFADPVGDIGDPFNLGDLLPPTELAFPQPEEREIIPALVDREPTIVIVTPDNPTGSVSASSSVNEAGLPARGSEPAGSSAASNSETVTGSIVFTAPDGLASITIAGIAIDGVPVTAVGQTFISPRGTLTITSISSNAIGYSYTLADNTLTPAPAEIYAITVTDLDGDTASGTLTINVIDDVPTARADTDAVAAGTYGPEAGNVLTGVGTTSGAAGADTRGADGATLTGVRAGDSGNFTAIGGEGTTIAGQYGTLTLGANGSYSYTRNPGTPGGVNDVFSYQLTDGDGDNSTATLTISIGDSGVVVMVPAPNGATTVNEAGLPVRDGEPAGSASDTTVETTMGVVTLNVIDGPGVVTINGTVITTVGQTIVTDRGVLTITSISATEIGYNYTLTDNTSNDSTTDVFTVTVTDVDGDSATAPLVITIVDDVPTAKDDADSVTEDGPLVADGNVLTGTGGSDTNATDGNADVQGA